MSLDPLDDALADLGFGAEIDSERSGAGGPVRPARWPLVASALGAALVVASLWLNWVKARAGSRTVRVDGFDLVLVPIVLIGATVVLAIGVFRDLVRRGRSTSRPAAVASGSLVVFQLLLLSLLESAAALIPRGLMPVTIRRLSVGVSPGIGLWVALLGAAACFLTTSGLLTGAVPGFMAMSAAWASKLERQRVGVLLVAAAAVVLGVGRYQPWASGHVGGSDLRLDGWAVPWLGPLSALGLWCLAALALLLFVRPRVVVSFAAAAAGWVTTVTGAVVIVGIGGVRRLGLARRVGTALQDGIGHRIQSVAGHRVGAIAPSIAAGRGPWLAFAAGLLAIVGAALVLPSRPASVEAP